MQHKKAIQTIDEYGMSYKYILLHGSSVNPYFIGLEHKIQFMSFGC